MNRLIKNLLTLSAVAIFAVSCNEEDPEGPGPALPDVDVTVTINGDAATSPYELFVGDSIGFSISGTVEGGFNTLNVYQSVDGGADVNIFTTNRDILGIDAGTQVLPVIEIGKTLTEDDMGDVVFTAEIVDENEPSNIGEEMIEVTVSPVEVVSYTEKLLYAQLVSEDSKTFFSTNLGSTVTKNEVDASAAPNSSDIDFGYAIGASGTAWLASPSNYPTFTAYDLSIWNDLNTTNFKEVTLTTEEFIAIKTNTQLEDLYTNSTATAADRVSEVAAGDFYALQLDEAKGGGYALVRVIAKVDGNEDQDFIDSTDYLEIEVLVEGD